MIERQTISKEGEMERAILVGVCTRQMEFEQAKDYLDELAFLAETAGARAVRSFIQKLDKPVNATYVGSGKLEEIRLAVEQEDANLVIFDDDLSPSQIRNLDEALEVKVLDRSSLILYIFSERAQTAQARTQVDLAQYQYLLPRLSGMWTHLSRQKGGIGLKGAGEKEIETDRRIIRDKIARLQKDLVKIDLQEQTRRKNRSEFVRIALIGYTNVGKSTLMNRLAKSEVLEENKLFATLDTTVRKVSLKGIPFLLSDTVGFIRKLPHHLVECFKSTLAESRESNLLLHVVDASHPHLEEQIEVVKQTLEDMKLQERPMITVFNKVDMLEPEVLEQLRSSWHADQNAPAVFISAAKNLHIEDLRELIIQELVKGYTAKSYNGQMHHFLIQHQYYQMTEEDIEG
ncbi:MAG: GTPase HflX [Bacteroidia bacterium]